MTLLFTSAVCDRCNPPKPAAVLSTGNPDAARKLPSQMADGESWGDVASCNVWTCSGIYMVDRIAMGHKLSNSQLFSSVHATVAQIHRNGYKGDYWIVGLDAGNIVRYIRRTST